MAKHANWDFGLTRPRQCSISTSMNYLVERSARVAMDSLQVQSHYKVRVHLNFLMLSWKVFLMTRTVQYDFSIADALAWLFCWHFSLTPIEYLWFIIFVMGFELSVAMTNFVPANLLSLPIYFVM